MSTLLFSFSFCYSQTREAGKQAKIKDRILKETREGGKYDFFTQIKGHEYDGVQIKPGIYDTKLGLALILWGKVNYDLGVSKLEDAYMIFSQHKGSEISSREKEYIKIGYNRELDK